MKILQIHNYYATRGGECQVVDDEKVLLERKGNQVFQFVKHSSSLSSMSVYEKADGFMRIPYNKKVKLELEAYLRECRPDVAHVHNVFPLLTPAVYDALANFNIPIVQTIHNYRFLCPNGAMFIHGEICEKCKSRSFRHAVVNRCVRNSLFPSMQYAVAINNMWKKRIITQKITKFIALNNFGKKMLTDAGVCEEKITLCGNFVLEQKDSEQHRTDYILYMGRLSAEKGVMTLLNAAAIASEVKVIIAGGGPLEGEIASAVNQLRNVECIGYVSGADKQRLLSHALAMVVPSEWYENFPVSVVEAMSAGVPVIASNIGGLPEMLENGVSGMLFEPGDTVKLAELMKLFAQGGAMADKMRVAASEYSRKQFSAEQHANRLETIYREARAVSKSDEVTGAG